MDVDILTQSEYKGLHQANHYLAEALMTFQTKERKIIIISLLALAVAVVTFGILGSSGTFKNSLYDLGGAIVGFLITATLLNKFYGVDPGEIPASELKGRAFLSEETVKILDMRNQQPLAADYKHTVPTNRVVLIDHYRLKKIGDQAAIKFPYATGGYGMEGSCISHQTPLEDKTDDPTEAGEDKHLRKQYEIELDVRAVAKGEVLYIHNAVTYINAFDGPTKDWFHTHVNLPTKSLTIILLFPQAQRCICVKGTEKVGKDAAREVERENLPILVDEGEIVYWRIPNPLIGAGYKLEWEWDNNVKATQPAVA